MITKANQMDTRNQNRNMAAAMGRNALMTALVAATISTCAYAQTNSSSGINRKTAGQLSGTQSPANPTAARAAVNSGVNAKSTPTAKSVNRNISRVRGGAGATAGAGTTARRSGTSATTRSGASGTTRSGTSATTGSTRRSATPQKARRQSSSAGSRGSVNITIRGSRADARAARQQGIESLQSANAAAAAAQATRNSQLAAANNAQAQQQANAYGFGLTSPLNPYGGNFVPNVSSGLPTYSTVPLNQVTPNGGIIVGPGTQILPTPAYPVQTAPVPITSFSPQNSAGFSSPLTSIYGGGFNFGY